MNLPERRELGGVAVTAVSGHVAEVEKCGLPTLDGQLEVRFQYRGSRRSAFLPYAATVAEVQAAMLAMLPAIDEVEDWNDQLASLNGEVV